MAYRHKIPLAALLALPLLAGACVVSLKTPENMASVIEPAIEPEAAPGTPEFHAARIGDDALRSRL